MDAPLYSLPSQRRAPLFWRFHCIYMHTYIRLVGLTVSHRPHFSMFLFSGITVAWYIPWSVKCNSIHVLIQLNWGLVHSIYYVPNVVAPAIVMHWQLPHTCQSSLCCLLFVHNALPVRVSVAWVFCIAHPTICCSNHVVVYTRVLHHTIFVLLPVQSSCT